MSKIIVKNKDFAIHMLDTKIEMLQIMITMVAICTITKLVKLHVR